MRMLRCIIGRAGAAAALGCALGLAATATPATAQPCAGDCDGGGTVVVNELIICVNIALGNAQVDTCSPCDVNGDGMVVINELVIAVNAALTSCTPVGPTPTPTVMATSCPLQPGKYTITSLQGGKLKVGSFSEFDFPAGGEIIADVGPGDANCVQSAVVPFPEPMGFTAPVFCIPALGLTTSVTQTGCGIGQLDSDGGSDYTVSELGDTSDASDVCNIPQATCPAGGPAPDSNIRVQVTVGDGTPDTCAGGGTVNALIAVPVDTLSWKENSSGDFCGIVDITKPCTTNDNCEGGRACLSGLCANGADGTFDEAQGDAEVSHFPQILDFTTDATSAKFQDLDGNGCSKSGTGPAAGFTRTGTCMDLTKLNTGEPVATTAAVGTVGSTGAPFDLAFATLLPNKVDGPDPALNATCANPPLINFTGVAERCIRAAAP